MSCWLKYWIWELIEYVDVVMCLHGIADRTNTDTHNKTTKKKQKSNCKTKSYVTCLDIIVLNSFGSLTIRIKFIQKKFFSKRLLVNWTIYAETHIRILLTDLNEISIRTDRQTEEEQTSNNKNQQQRNGDTLHFICGV